MAGGGTTNAPSIAMVFVDRRHAGVELAERLKHLRAARPVVLALPRGGVPVGYEVARALGAPLEVLVARKMGAPWQPELGIGAIAEGGVIVFDEQAVASLGVRRADLAQAARAEQAELDRRVARYRGKRRLPDLVGKTAILVDDGVAMGVTMLGAIAAVRGRCDRVVVAVPVGAPQALDRLREEADDVIALEEPADLASVGSWYGEFPQLDDDQVMTYLEGTRVETPASSAIVRIAAGDAVLEGDLDVPLSARGLVVFAHGSGSSRFSPRNRHVARRFHEAGLATLLLDLLTTDEERVDERTGELRFDIPFLARRVAAAIDWVHRQRELAGLRIGVFGASTGAAAALIGAVLRPERVAAVVSRGGRPDLAGPLLGRVRAPTLLVVGGWDVEVLALNRDALVRLGGEKRLDVIPGATHLFEETGALDEVARLAADWFSEHLARADQTLRP
jgi:putative phosphoribosyl transferase